jgi:hypothetical protein
MSTATINDFSNQAQLIPAAINSKLQSAGNALFRKPSSLGSTIDQEGRTNNYSVEPQMTYAAESTDKEKFRLGVLFAIATWVPIGIAVLVS